MYPRSYLNNRFNLIRVTAAHEWDTHIRIQKGLFEYTVVACGLTNPSATFQDMIDKIFKAEEGCMWHMYDILINGRVTEVEYKLTCREHSATLDQP